MRTATRDISGVVVGAQRRLNLLAETIQSLASKGDATFARHVADGHDQLYLTDIAYLREHEAFFADRPERTEIELSRSVGLLAISRALN
jgi:hypothetical protein